MLKHLATRYVPGTYYMVDVDAGIVREQN